MSHADSNTVLLFGSFDGIHQGHIYHIKNARKLASKLIIVIAQDEVIELIKHRPPVRMIEQRINDMQKLFPKTTVIAGDTEPGKWSAIKKYKPKIVATGYDQDNLRKALANIQGEYGFEIETIGACEPGVYKSSILRGK